MVLLGTDTGPAPAADSASNSENRRLLPAKQRLPVLLPASLLEIITSAASEIVTVGVVDAAMRCGFRPSEN